MRNDMKVWYLYHSGFAVEACGCLLLFDYWNNKEEGDARTLENGVFDPMNWLSHAALEAHGDIIPPVIVFSSHKHGDHFLPEILQWQDTIPGIRYVLSQDIPKRYFSGMPKEEIVEAGNPEETGESTRIVRMKPYQTHSWPELDMIVHTFKSTDAGVAFWVEIAGQVIYHAGDLNLWFWETESKTWNKTMTTRFHQEMEFVAEWSEQTGKIPDIALLPADPRLGVHWLDGFAYFLEKVGAKHAFPMHFGEAYPESEKLKTELTAKMAEFSAGAAHPDAGEPAKPAEKQPSEKQPEDTQPVNPNSGMHPAKKTHLHVPGRRGEMYNIGHHP